MLPDVSNVLLICSTEGLVLTMVSVFYSCYDGQEIRIGSAVWEVVAVPSSGHGKGRLGSRLGSL